MRNAQFGRDVETLVEKVRQARGERAVGWWRVPAGAAGWRPSWFWPVGSPILGRTAIFSLMTKSAYSARRRQLVGGGLAVVGVDLRGGRVRLQWHSHRGEKMVLSAANCVDGGTPADYKVVTVADDGNYRAYPVDADTHYM